MRNMLEFYLELLLCVGDDTADSYCWQMQFLVAGFVLPSSRDESELSRARSSPGPHW